MALGEQIRYNTAKDEMQPWQIVAFANAVLNEANSRFILQLAASISRLAILLGCQDFSAMIVDQGPKITTNKDEGKGEGDGGEKYFLSTCFHLKRRSHETKYQYPVASQIKYFLQCADPQNFESL